MLFLRVTVFAKWPRHVRVRPEYVRIHEISLDGDLHRDQELQSRKHPLLANADSSSSNHCVVRNARGLPVDLRAVRVHRGLLRHRRKVVPMIKFGCDRALQANFLALSFAVQLFMVVMARRVVQGTRPHRTQEPSRVVRLLKAQHDVLSSHDGLADNVDVTHRKRCSKIWNDLPLDESLSVRGVFHLTLCSKNSFPAPLPGLHLCG